MLFFCVCFLLCRYFYLSRVEAARQLYLRVKREHESFVGSKDERLAVDGEHVEVLGGCLDVIESLREGTRENLSLAFFTEDCEEIMQTKFDKVLQLVGELRNHLVQASQNDAKTKSHDIGIYNGTNGTNGA